MKEYDVVIIGAGAGGLTSAITARGFGKSVLLIEKDKPGGECTWSGCIPSKALINYAKEIHVVRKHVPGFVVDANKPFQKVQEVIQSVYEEETPEKLEEMGIDVEKGVAHFVSEKSIEVNGEEIHGKYFIIATGSKPALPRIKGVEQVEFLTNESIFRLEELPGSLMIVGTGAIGIEMAQAMNRLGVSVTVVGRSSGILKKEEKELSNKLMGILSDEGIRFVTGIEMKSLEEQEGMIVLQYEENGESKLLSAEKLLLATGRKPAIELLCLDNAMIDYTKKGIIVNDYLRTTNPHVYAVGDVVGPYQFSHMANVQGIRVVQNISLPIERKIDYRHVAWCTFTDPELARAGMTEEEAKESHGDVKVYTYDYSQLDRVKTKPGSTGEIKVILDKRGHILGTSILGERAGELISEVQVLKTLGIPYKKLLNVIHPYPTYGEALNKISKTVAVDALLSNPIVKTFRKGE